MKHRLRLLKCIKYMKRYTNYKMSIDFLKMCPKCNVPQTLEHFSYRNKLKNWRSSWCIDCTSTMYYKRRYKNLAGCLNCEMNKVLDLNNKCKKCNKKNHIKICCKCNREKSINEFYANRKTCKECY